MSRSNNWLVLATLRQQFELDRRPNRLAMKQLARGLDMTPHQVATWFKCRRQRSGKNNNNNSEIVSEDDEENSSPDAEEPPSDPVVEDISIKQELDLVAPLVDVANICIKQEVDLDTPVVEEQDSEPIHAWSPPLSQCTVTSFVVTATTTTASNGFATKSTDSPFSSKCLFSTSTDTAARQDMELELTSLRVFDAYARYWDSQP